MKDFRSEVWKPFEIENCDLEKEKIKVSNYGRIKRKKTSEEDFELCKNSKINNFGKLSITNLKKGRNVNYYVHRAVALLFLDKLEGQRFVIHKNHDLEDNYIKNLQWVDQKELTKHQHTNPKRRKKYGIKPTAKLTEGKVRIIKKKLLDPNRRTRLRIIASQFGITVTQLYRIKSGENWGEIKV